MIAPEAAPAPKLTRNENLKSNHTTLAGTIAQTLANPEVDHFTDDDYEFLKFHGVYQKDDRDKRKVARQWNFRNSRSEEHTSELQSRGHLVCRLLLEKKKDKFRLSTRLA